MLEASGCCIPPPKPAIPEATRSTTNTGDAAIPTSPADTQMLPNTSIQNSPTLSARNPAGICNTPDAPLKTDLIRPTSVNDRSMSSLIKGKRGTIKAKNRSLQMCMVEPKIRVRLALGALVKKEINIRTRTSYRHCFG